MRNLLADLTFAVSFNDLMFRLDRSSSSLQADKLIKPIVVRSVDRVIQDYLGLSGEEFRVIKLGGGMMTLQNKSGAVRDWFIRPGSGTIHVRSIFIEGTVLIIEVQGPYVGSVGEPKAFPGAIRD